MILFVMPILAQLLELEVIFGVARSDCNKGNRQRFNQHRPVSDI